MSTLFRYFGSKFTRLAFCSRRRRGRRESPGGESSQKPRWQLCRHRNLKFSRIIVNAAQCHSLKVKTKKGKSTWTCFSCFRCFGCFRGWCFWLLKNSRHPKDTRGYQQDFMKRVAAHPTSLIFRYFVFLSDPGLLVRSMCLVVSKWETFCETLLMWLWLIKIPTQY